MRYACENEHLMRSECFMNCPHRASLSTKEQSKRTILGYRTFRCTVCKRFFNERTGTPFNYLEVPTDIILLVVLWRLRYKLSLRDVAEMFWSAGGPSPMRRPEIGKLNLPHCLRTNCEESGMDKREDPGMSMKRTSKCMGSGATSIERLITMAIWWIRS